MWWHRNMWSLLRMCFLMVMVGFLSGCAAGPVAIRDAAITNLMLCPNLYAPMHGANLFGNTPAIYQANPVRVFYFTDREPLTDPANVVLNYGSKRGQFVSFGEARVRIGNNMDWAKLSQVSVEMKRKHNLPVAVRSLHPILSLIHI